MTPVDDQFANIRDTIHCINSVYEPLPTQLRNCLSDSRKTPFQGMILAREIGEYFAKDVIRRLGHRPHEKFVECIRQLKSPRIHQWKVPLRVVNDLDRIRDDGNKAAHEASKLALTHAAAAAHLHRLLLVVQWYHVDFQLAPKNGPFFVRPPAQLRAEVDEDVQIPATLFFTDTFRSRFAGTPAEVETVLDLRRRFFGTKVLVPDDVYRNCWHKNRRSMKVVTDLAGRPVGYWSIVPVNRPSFERFLTGGVSHADMLENGTLAWGPEMRDETYLYITGTVVPSQTVGTGERPSSEIATRVILDWLQFIVELRDLVRIRGTCGYPATDSGRKLMDRFRLPPTGKYVLGNQNHPIYSVPEAAMPEAFRQIDGQLERLSHLVPLWDPADRQQFVRVLGGGSADPE